MSIERRDLATHRARFRRKRYNGATASISMKKTLAYPEEKGVRGGRGTRRPLTKKRAQGGSA